MKKHLQLKLNKIREILKATDKVSDKDLIEFCITFAHGAHVDWNIKYKESYDQLMTKGGDNELGRRN